MQLGMRTSCLKMHNAKMGFSHWIGLVRLIIDGVMMICLVYVDIKALPGCAPLLVPLVPNHISSHGSLLHSFEMTNHMKVLLGLITSS